MSLEINISTVSDWNEALMEMWVEVNLDTKHCPNSLTDMKPQRLMCQNYQGEGQAQQNYAKHIR